MTKLLCRTLLYVAVLSSSCAAAQSQKPKCDADLIANIDLMTKLVFFGTYYPLSSRQAEAWVLANHDQFAAVSKPGGALEFPLTIRRQSGVVRFTSPIVSNKSRWLEEDVSSNRCNVPDKPLIIKFELADGRCSEEFDSRFAQLSRLERLMSQFNRLTDEQLAESARDPETCRFLLTFYDRNLQAAQAQVKSKFNPELFERLLIRP